jgi:hypothetical protein
MRSSTSSILNDFEGLQVLSTLKATIRSHRSDVELAHDRFNSMTDADFLCVHRSYPDIIFLELRFWTFHSSSCLDFGSFTYPFGGAAYP